MAARNIYLPAPTPATGGGMGIVVIGFLVLAGTMVAAYFLTRPKPDPSKNTTNGSNPPNTNPNPTNPNATPPPKSWWESWFPSSSTGSSNSGNGGTVPSNQGNNPGAQGVPIPVAGVTPYIDRIAQLLLSNPKGSQKCEVCRNLGSMRNDEIITLNNHCIAAYGFAVRPRVDGFNASGCFFWFTDEDLEKAKARLSII
jgi:hypothetical protein